MELVVINNEQSKDLVELLLTDIMQELLVLERSAMASDDFITTRELCKTSKTTDKHLHLKLSTDLSEMFYENIYQEHVTYDDLIECGEPQLTALGRMLESVRETQTNNIVLIFPMGLLGSIGMVITQEEVS